MKIDSVLQSYWDNEAKITSLVINAGSDINYIVDNAKDFSKETVLQLEGLLYRKKDLLNVLGIAQKKAIVSSAIVDLAEYRQLASFRTV